MPPQEAFAIGTIRIVAGSVKGRKLLVPRDADVRPTLNRIREPMFTILGESLAGCSVLDLFAGSGALGLEALSRGARHAVFVEANPICLRAIRENLNRCGFCDGVHVLKATLPRDFQKVKKVIPHRVDVVFLDPPYNAVGKTDLLEALQHFSLLKENARIVFEHFYNDASITVPADFFLEDQRRYGDTGLTFIEYKPGERERDDD